MTGDQIRMQVSCPLCQQVAGGNAPCNCPSDCTSVLCRHADFSDIHEFVPPSVPRFR